ncbi:hypothetical protein CAC42_4299 [Sphaceloma murrayae]|uniref:Uncharacterized protein n=1 Tax=Sphaceloma murrayae TaxID=2082308 RepID=A0A2K1QL22_9PEZI|nr:hypothetical protein CAC42_4299 [Sphaceloma murrayae]
MSMHQQNYRLPPPMRLRRTGKWYAYKPGLDVVLPSHTLHFSEGSKPALHNGRGDSAPVLAMIRPHMLSDSELGLADQSSTSGGQMAWNTLQTSLTKGCTRFTVPGRKGGRGMVWQRRPGDGGDLQLKDETTGRMLAFFRLWAFAGKDRGRFEWFEELTFDEEIAAIMILLSIYVKEAERWKKVRRHRRGAHSRDGGFFVFADGGGGGGWGASDGGGGCGDGGGGGGDGGGGGGGC